MAVTTATVFYPVLSHEFLNLDDHVYVTQNQHVQSGLNFTTIKWAFTTIHAEFWHPLTWISLSADTSLYGKAARGYLTTNLLLHVGNTLLVFYVFYHLTGFFARSLIVAALFALHPLHVETVAWISDRKDLLCTFFWFIGVWAYLRYQRQPVAGRYFVLVTVFILAILAKPMAITFPCVLLLLDIWPLKRISFDNGLRTFVSRALGLIREKGLLFVLAIIGGLIAIYAQQAGGGLGSISEYPLTVRLGNAALSYYRYTLKTIWPHDLAVFYPYLSDHSYLHIIAALLFLSAVTGIAIFQLRRRPYLAVGWFWFLGMMVPVIGLFKIGDFAMADRYTYTPIIGLFIMVVWSSADWFAARRRMGIYCATALVAIVFTGLVYVTWHQIKPWRNSEALYRHALQVTDNNYIAHYGLGQTLASQGQFNEAVKHFEQAAELKPNKRTILLALGRAMTKVENYSEASAVLEKCVAGHPRFPEARFTLGLILTIEKQYELALKHFSEALRQLQESRRAAHELRHIEVKHEYERAVALLKKDQSEQAIRSFRRVLDLQPEFLPARDRLRQYFLTNKEFDHALAIYHIKNDHQWLRNGIISGYDRWANSFR